MPNPTNAVAIAVGDRVLRFEPIDESTTCVVLGVAASFVVDSMYPPDCVVACEIGDPRPDGSLIVTDAPPIWELRRRADGAEEVTFYASSGADRAAFAKLIIDPSRTAARMVRRPEDASDGVFRIGFPLDEFLMCRLAAADATLVLHAAAVEWQGRAFLFVGHSGAGKSTIAGVSRECGARILSDDRSLVRIDGAGATAWGTPWHGSLRAGHPSAAPLGAIFLLDQAVDDWVEPITPSRASGELLVRLIHPAASAREFEGLLDAVIALSLRVPMGVLHFTPTSEAFRRVVRFATEQAHVEHGRHSNEP